MSLHFIMRYNQQFVVDVNGNVVLSYSTSHKHVTEQKSLFWHNTTPENNSYCLLFVSLACTYQTIFIETFKSV